MKKYLCFWLYFISGVAFAQQQLLQERNYLPKTTNSQIWASTPDKQGNILYSGNTWVGVSQYEHRFLMVKPNADTLWTRKSPTILDREAQALKTLPNGSFIFGGIIRNNNTVAISLQKLTSTGQRSWIKNYLNVPSAISAMLPLPNKDIFMGVGYGYNKNFSFLRTDSLGNIKWHKDYTWGSYDGILDMKFTSNGNIIAVGITDNPAGPYHPKLVLVNQNGDSLKGKQLIVHSINRGEGMNYNFSGVTPLSDGGFLLTAEIDTVNASFPAGADMGMVVKVDSSLNLQWKYIHRTPATDQYVFTKAKELTDGTILVLGFKIRPAQGGNGFQIYRFKPTGQLKDVYPFTSSICSQVWGITFDALADSTFLIGGRCGNNPPISYGFYVAKVKIPGLPPVVPPFTISATKEEMLLAGTNLGQSYPNPTTSEAIIPYSLPKDFNKASIIIREIATGRETRKYDLKPNSSSLTVDLSSLSNGLYLYSLVVDDIPVATKKLAVMK